MPSDDEIRQIIADEGLSPWFKMALTTALECDPVAAAHDAGLLSAVLDQRAGALTADLIAQKLIQKAKERP